MLYVSKSLSIYLEVLRPPQESYPPHLNWGEKGVYSVEMLHTMLLGTADTVGVQGESEAPYENKGIE